ncbi:MAG: hypothetical protein ACTSQJ_03820 [Promethearchaeota archaeon]
MLFKESESTIIFILGLIIATIIVSIVIYLVVKAIESPKRASDKKIIIILVAFLAVLILPIIAGIFGLILGFIGDSLARLRTLIYPSGQNFLIQLVVILYFLMLLMLIKFLIDVRWESALWISLITLFIMYFVYTIIPELYIIIHVG